MAMIPKTKTILLMLSAATFLQACVTDKQVFIAPEVPTKWQSQEEKQAFYKQFKDDKEAKTLKAWWTLFSDPVMDRLIRSAMALSPDRAIALTKVKEARGIQRSTSSSLFPQISGSANASREDRGTLGVGEYYDAAFDASYELDIFGENRNAAAAAGLDVQALQAQYEDVTLTLIADVARTYTEFRFYEKQVKIAKNNLETEEQTAGLIKQQNDLGEATQLDVERAQNQVNNTRASIPELKNLSDSARLRLSVLTGLLPEYITEIVKTEQPIPRADVLPVLATPSSVLNERPDVLAARIAFAAETKTAASVTATIFPNITISGLFGVQDSAFTSSTSIWGVALGAAVSLIDFGRIEGNIEAAKAREEQAYQLMRKSILEAVMDVEQSMVAYAHINEQKVALEQSLQNARKAHDLSMQLYKEGEISFLDQLDAQRSVNSAELAASEADYQQSVALIALYKSLGVY